MKDPGSNLAQVTSTISASTRVTYPKANSFHHIVEVRREDREESTCPKSVDDTIECESDYGQDGEVGSPTLGSALSNRQKNREVKMKFRPQSDNKIHTLSLPSTVY